MGRIRALSAEAHPHCKVVHVCDVEESLATSAGNEMACSSSTDWLPVLERTDVNAVVVATPHKFLAEIAIAALRAGKHVFCEKPMARTAVEADYVLTSLTQSATGSGIDGKSKPVAVVGYTLRHHPAVAHGRRIVASGVIGEPLYVRGRYGHGGRAGYEKEWRGSRDLSGGGELLDQGVHLIDLSRWFLGEFRQVVGFADSYFWHTRTAQSFAAEIIPGHCLLEERSVEEGEVEDNAFMMLRTEQNKTALLHVSWTQWKNLFSFEVFGTNGFVCMEGLGGNYGPERLVIARRRAAGGVPDMQEIVFKQPAEAGSAIGTLTSEYQQMIGKGPLEQVDLEASCWDEEWDHFVDAIRKQSANRPTEWHSASAALLDGVQTLRIVDAVYQSARESMPVDVDAMPEELQTTWASTHP